MWLILIARGGAVRRRPSLLGISLPSLVGISASYATSPYKGVGDIDIAEVEQQVLFEPSFLCTGILQEPLLEREAGG